MMDKRVKHFYVVQTGMTACGQPQRGRTWSIHLHDATCEACQNAARSARKDAARCLRLAVRSAANVTAGGDARYHHPAIAALNADDRAALANLLVESMLHHMQGDDGDGDESQLDNIRPGL
jgi:hypothetical protein